MFSRLISSVLTGMLLLPGLGLFASDGSLWSKKHCPTSMFSDRIARQVGDILTILVQESSSVRASKSSSLSKENSIGTEIQRLLDEATTDYPGLGWEVGSDFAGSGQMSDTQSASSRLSVVVIDRLPNGNLVIEGMRQVVMANERNFAVLRGYVRPDDITASNTILSSQIADAQIEFVAEGSLTESQRQGWLNRLYSFLSPF